LTNLLLTNYCVRSCPYCFARKHLAEAEPDDRLSWEDLIYVADLQEGHDRHLSLLGGEPTLHPQYLDMVAYLMARGFHVTTFTSGIMSEKMLTEMEEMLADVPPDQANFVVNLNDPTLSPEAEVARVKKFLERFGERSTPGFNIYRTDFSLDFIFEYVNAFGMVRHLRLGAAHPIVGHDNVFIRPEDMEAIAARLRSYFPQFLLHKIGAGLDCGFPLCKFTDEDVGMFYQINKGNIHFGCGPAIDIGPDMTVWSCFPLSSYHKKSLFEFNHINEVMDYYNTLHRNVRVEAGGLYEACDECRHRDSGVCAGGCLAHGLNPMQHEPPVRILTDMP
jgi:radical SAM protein with 4Fe4S-binding SPASM domain